MAIEFNCEHCGKALSTSEDKAGRRAKCPQCGELVVVPAAPETDFVDEDNEDAALEPPPLPGERATKNCPMCGGLVPASATICQHCGETLFVRAPRGLREPRKLDTNSVMSESWTIFKGEMGIVVGGVIVASLLSGAGQLPMRVLIIVAQIAQQQGERDTAIVCSILSWCFWPIAFLVQWYMTLGQTRLLLNVARGETAQMGDLFTGGKYFWRMIGSSFLFTLMVWVGCVACIIPGIILSLMFWPYYLLLVDEDPPGIECLTRAKEITKDNLGSIFGLFILVFGVNLLGVLAVCIGLIFTLPLSTLMLVVAYCHMTGQRTAAEPG